ncbi:MAG: alpha/beta fold hydrolase [Gemmatimonadales bacterium]
MTPALLLNRALTAATLGLMAVGATNRGDTPPVGSAPWTDPSPHRVLRIAVAPQVQLEVLDWGGSGEPLVFLAGFGNSAHVFDGFAPAFVPHFHVLGVTRRGFGASSKPATGYDTTTLVHDILAVLDSLHFKRASFAAHSFGGSELNYLGAHFPARVDRLVYLDAAVDHRQLYDSPTWLAAFPPPEPPYATYGDYGGDSIAAWLLWAERLSGPGYPEAEVRSMFRYDQSDLVTGRTAADSIDRVLQRGTLPAELSRIRVPVLAIYAVAGSAPVMYPFWDALDSTARARARKSFAAISSAFAGQEVRFRREVKDVRIREIPGARHYVFLTDPGEVRHQMLEFLLRRG